MCEACYHGYCDGPRVLLWFWVRHLRCDEKDKLEFNSFAVSRKIGVVTRKLTHMCDNEIGVPGVWLFDAWHDWPLVHFAFVAKGKWKWILVEISALFHLYSKLSLTTNVYKGNSWVWFMNFLLNNILWHAQKCFFCNHTPTYLPLKKSFKNRNERKPNTLGMMNWCKGGFALTCTRPSGTRLYSQSSNQCSSLFFFHFFSRYTSIPMVPHVRVSFVSPRASSLCDWETSVCPVTLVAQSALCASKYKNPRRLEP